MNSSLKTTFHSSAIDLARGFAALWVVFYHAYIWIGAPDAPNAFKSGYAEWLGNANIVDLFTHGMFAYGFLGVNAFFLISGFCIHAPNHAKNVTRLDTKNFIARRIARIYPLYIAITILLFILYGPILGLWQEKGVNLQNLIGHFFLWHYAGPPSASGMGISGVMWTLALEIQFYCLYALLYGTIKRFGAGRIALIFLVAEISYRAAFNLLDVDLDGAMAVFSPARFSLLRFGEWMLGAWLAELWLTGSLGRLSSQFSKASASLIFASATALLLSCIWLGGQIGLDKYDATDIPAAFSFVIILALLISRLQGGEFGVLRNTLKWAGDRCFSIYLTHATVLLVFAKIFQNSSALSNLNPYVVSFLAVGTALVVGAIAYVAIERPSHNYSKTIGTTRKRSAPVNS